MTLDRKIKWFTILLLAANLVIVLIVVLGAFKKEHHPKPLTNPNATNLPEAGGSPK